MLINTRVLVIDDEQIVRESFQNILSESSSSTQIQAAAANLFNEPIPIQESSEVLKFKTDIAENGRQGLEKVQHALKENEPYSVIFVDMRMPGWDGLETVQHIRKIDERAEIIFVTAYSDHSIEDIVDKAGPNVGYYCKPFVPDEIKQVATKSVYDWCQLRELENLIEVTTSLSTKEYELNVLLTNILNQVTTLVGAHSSALIYEDKGNHNFIPVAVVGCAKDQDYCQELFNTMKHNNNFTIMKETNEYLFIPMESYGVIIIKDHNNMKIKKNRIYLLHLFLKQAEQVIANCQLSKQVEKMQRLSSMGQAASYIVHDLRNPVSIIQTCTTMLEKPNTTESNSVKCLNMIKENSIKMLDYIEEILNFSRDKIPDRKTITAHDFFSIIHGTVSHTLNDNDITLKVEYEKDISLLIDPYMMEKVIVNLINNAIQATSVP